MITNLNPFVYKFIEPYLKDVSIKVDEFIDTYLKNCESLIDKRVEGDYVAILVTKNKIGKNIILVVSMGVDDKVKEVLQQAEVKNFVENVISQIKK